MNSSQPDLLPRNYGSTDQSHEEHLQENTGQLSFEIAN